MKISAIGTPGITSNASRFSAPTETTDEPVLGRSALSSAQCTMSAAEAIDLLREQVHEVLNKVRRGVPAATPDQPQQRLASTPSATPRTR